MKDLALSEKNERECSVLGPFGHSAGVSPSVRCRVYVSGGRAVRSLQDVWGHPGMQLREAAVSSRVCGGAHQWTISSDQYSPEACIC